MADSNLASVSACPKLLRTVIKPSTFTCSAPALGQRENEGDDRQPDQNANPEATRHVGLMCVGFIKRTRTIGFHWRARYPPNGSRKPVKRRFVRRSGETKRIVARVRFRHPPSGA